MNLLFTCAGRRHYLLQFFKQELQGQGSVFAADMQLSAPAMAVADRRFRVPAISDPTYVDAVLALCRDHAVDALIPLNDLELPILAARRRDFTEAGTTLLLSDASVVHIAFDKCATVTFAESVGLRTPRTFTHLTTALEAIAHETLRFPVVVKPRWGSASIGVDYAETTDELTWAHALLARKLQRTILAEASAADADQAILIQERIAGVEYGIDILNDLAGNPVQVYVKEKLAMRAGETDKAILRDRPDIEEFGRRIGSALHHVGNLDCDVIDRNGELVLLEMNPRFGGGYPFTHLAGGNYVAALLAWLRGAPVDPAIFTKDFTSIWAKSDTVISV